MGVISDQFKRDLDEMRARHAVTERQLAESRERVFESLRKLQELARDFEDA